MHQQNVKHITKQFTNVLKINYLINFLPVLTCLSEFFLRKQPQNILLLLLSFFLAKGLKKFLQSRITK